MMQENLSWIGYAIILGLTLFLIIYAFYDGD